MTDLLDRAILIGMGLDKKLKEVLDELQKAGKKEATKEAAPGEEGAEELTPKQVVENRIVDEGVHVLKDLLGAVNKAKDKIEEELSHRSDKLLGRVHAARSEEIDVVREMARVAREKVDSLEKRLDELEKELKKDK